MFLIYECGRGKYFLVSSYTILEFVHCMIKDVIYSAVYMNGALWVVSGRISDSPIFSNICAKCKPLYIVCTKKMLSKDFGQWWEAKSVRECQIHTLNLFYWILWTLAMTLSSCRLLHSENNMFKLTVVNLFLTSLYNPPIVQASSSTKKCEAE